MFAKDGIEFISARGERLLFDGEPFGLVSVEGLGDVDADLQTQPVPFVDGETYLDSVLKPRFIPLEIIVRGGSYDEVIANRRMLSRILNPKFGAGIFRYGDDRELEAVAESVPFFPDKYERGERWQRGFVTLVAHNPYWQTTAESVEPAFEGLFEFPFEGEFEFGIQRSNRTIINDSDSPAPVKVTFYGPAQTPQIFNVTTGEFIRINKELGENERLIVDTSDDKKSVYFVDDNGWETNVFHWLDLDSTFFKLEIGENEISCQCATSELLKDFDVSFIKQYVGV